MNFEEICKKFENVEGVESIQKIESITENGSDIYQIYINRHVGLLNSEGDYILSPEYDKINTSDEDDRFVTIKKAVRAERGLNIVYKSGLFDLKNKKIITDCVHDDIVCVNVFRENTTDEKVTIITNIDGKYGMVDYNNDLLVDNIYDDYEMLFGDIIMFTCGNIEVFIDIAGKTYSKRYIIEKLSIYLKNNRFGFYLRKQQLNENKEYLELSTTFAAVLDKSSYLMVEIDFDINIKISSLKSIKVHKKNIIF